MRKTIFYLLCISVLQSGVYEVGLSGGINFFNRNDKTSSQHYTRFALHAGYQFHEISDQIGIAIRSDKFVDELDLNYMFVFPSFRKFTPFQTTPYFKPMIGIGNTYAKRRVLTHVSYGLGFGIHGKLTQKIRARFEIDNRSREWQLNRSGEKARVTSFKDKELGFYLGISYLF